MFGMGGSEIIVILIVALLFLGPEKLPDAAKKISKGIRDIKKQSRALQNQIESDEQIGGAIRDLKSALRGEEAPIRGRTRPAKAPALTENAPPAELPPPVETAPEGPPEPPVRLPETAGEPDPEVTQEDDDADLAKLIKPAEGTVAKTHG